MSLLFDVYGTADDGYVMNSNLNYATCHNAAVGTAKYDTTTRVGQLYDNFFTMLYFIYRGVLWFNTSLIPKPALVTGVKLRFVVAVAYLDVNFNIQICKGDGVAPHLPLVNGDYDMTHYSSNGGSVNTAALVPSPAFSEIVLNSTGMSWINLNGYTPMILLSDNDIASVPPGIHSATQYVEIWNGRATHDVCPMLEITYEGGRVLECPGIVNTSWEAGSMR